MCRDVWVFHYLSGRVYDITESCGGRGSKPITGWLVTSWGYQIGISEQCMDHWMHDFKDLYMDRWEVFLFLFYCQMCNHILRFSSFVVQTIMHEDAVRRLCEDLWAIGMNVVKILMVLLLYLSCSSIQYLNCTCITSLCYIFKGKKITN